MSTTYVDTDLLEQMRDRMFQTLSRIEETAGTLRQVHSQMMTEDLGLSFYPQWEQAVESCRRALQKAERLQDEAARLLTVLETAPEEYMQLEHQHRQMLERMNVRASALSAGIAGVMAEGYPLGLLEGEEASQAVSLERQTALAAEETGLAGLLAVTQVLRESCRYDQVLPGLAGDEEKERKDSEKKKGGGKEKSSSQEKGEQDGEGQKDGGKEREEKDEQKGRTG